ncbi:E3 ubiquitin-protein ligase TRIM39-like [Denticeps clupeoides]|uniref:E3 ubiquitin-protein ligase TRIM39-like n=1 Tax=Denticeps clupeoides TaxID=299321 RepID=UPI0010A2B042|nr:E3 ubiquitin-protein ligase TRIM39-like [Denticeps clupeoides]
MATSSPLLPTDCISQHLKCSICLDLLKDPVTTSCGHSFCEACLNQNNRENANECPLCKAHVNSGAKVNVVLKAVVEELQGGMELRHGKYTGAPGEVPCDACIRPPRLTATKSCLVCLASYCEEHLEPHFSKQRLKGHLLVAPLLDLDQRACLEHGRPLELFCLQSQSCVCALCVEDQAMLIPLEKAWDQKKEQLKKTRDGFQDEIRNKEMKKDEFRQSASECKEKQTDVNQSFQKHVDKEMTATRKVFAKVMEAVRRAEEEALKPLQDKRNRVEMEERELTQELQAEIDKLKDSVSKLNHIENVEDPIHSLQSFPSDVEEGAESRDWTDVAVDTDTIFGTMRNICTTLMAQIKTELEELTSMEIYRVQKFSVDVVLDPDTANPQLVLSEDGKTVVYGEQKQNVSDGPQRFDTFSSIVGFNQLTCGRAYWEVEVGEKTGWDIGVMSEEANRKGRLSFKPSDGYWVIVHLNGNQYAALEETNILLELQKKPKKVGVFVDHEEGVISFYDVEAKSHIHSFTSCGFPQNLTLYPYFSPHLPYGQENSGPLVIDTV